MPRILLALAPLSLAVMGAWLVRRHGWRHLWIAALFLGCGVGVLAYYVPSLELVKGSPGELGGAGVHTAWYPAGIIVMAASLHVSASRRIPSFVGRVVGVLFAWLAWEAVTAYSFWMS